MKSNLTLRIFVSLGAILLILFYLYGRSIWHPYYLKVKGKKTTETIYISIGEKVEIELKKKFSNVNISYPPEHFTIIGLKDERSLEIWANNTDGKLVRVDTYKFKGFSGALGPKLKSGDGQIPEGLYKIEYLNPNSSYHLSMKVSYPNVFDKEMAKLDDRKDLGGDIFIHGKSVTIGCIPIGDKNIEKLFVLAYKVGIENINVIISPYDMRIKEKSVKPEHIEWLERKYNRIKDSLQQYKKS